VIRASRELDPRARAARRLGVLGGSFDPPHLGHLHLARVARAARELEHVVFVPAGRPPHKTERDLAPVETRIGALEVLLEDEPATSIWTVEAERAGRSYTIDTLRELRGLVGPGTRIFLLLGEDNLASLPSWREVEAILDVAEPVIAPRREAPRGEVERRGSAGEQGGLDAATLSPRARERLERGRIDAEVLAASSTELRRRLARGEPPGAALPARLHEYLVATGLYRPR
jgi:nicotinate-nucleotide adenylyltransferase